MTEYRKKLILNKSPINDIGLFANEDIKKGEIIMIWSMKSFVISEDDYNKAQKFGNGLMIKTGCRFVHDIFLYTDNMMRFENYVNHSFKPNMLYHCGLCFAKTNITTGTELTVDYRFILANNDANSFIDNYTGQTVDGYDSHTCLVKSTMELLSLLE